MAEHDCQIGGGAWVTLRAPDKGEVQLSPQVVRLTREFRDHYRYHSVWRECHWCERRDFLKGLRDDPDKDIWGVVAARLRRCEFIERGDRDINDITIPLALEFGECDEALSVEEDNLSFDEWSAGLELCEEEFC